MRNRVLALLGLLFIAVPLSADQTADRAALTSGVGELVAPGCLPGPMAVFGRDAFVVLTAKSGSERVPLFAAVRAARGRALAGGHEGFFGAQALANPDNARFLSNCLTWLGKKPMGRLTVGVLDMGGMVPTLKQSGATVVELTRADVADKLQGLDVICLNQGSLDKDVPALTAVARYLQRGGGLLTAGPAWGWLWGAGEKQLATDHTGNYLLRRFGVAFADGTVDGPYNATGADDPLLNTDAALESLRAGMTPATSARALKTIERMITVLPRGEKNYAQRIELLAAGEKSGMVPTAEDPITEAQPLARLKAILDARDARGGDPSTVTAHPASADFPGAVPADAVRVSRTVKIDCAVPEWHGVGLYAAPGEVVRVTIPAQAVGAGLGVRIGSHTDTLWGLPKWQRFPEISTYKSLKAETTRVASAFGGTVYIVVPGGCRLGSIDVTVRNAVEAPRFVRGKTSLAEWRQRIRRAPGPWAELEGNLVILSVPSTSVRDLDDPEALMAYWDRVLEACYTLYAAPKRPRPERYCVDRQISAGYMHSGYPIMTWEDVAKTFCDLPKLEQKGGHLWGFYHEMGHNFQSGDWTFEGTGEVTNNLFSVYGQEKVVGLLPTEFGLAHPALKPEECRKRLTAYLGRGAKFSEWQGDPFLALTMYLQVRQAFGWEPFTKVFAEYASLPGDERPRSEEEKRNQWMVRLSRAVGKNLGPFFQAWGVPTSDAARQAVANLPGWMPEDLPEASR